MKKKPKLLTTLLSGEKRRHHVAAYITQEADWNQHEPNTGFARMFIAMLILHVLIIGWVILSDSSTGTKAPPRSPAAQALLTKSENELAGAQSQTAAAAVTTSTDKEKYETYDVRSGDSLPMIVARFGVDRDELISLNGLDKDAGFSSGTVLKIPNNKVSTPLQISPARSLPAMALVPPSSSTVGETESTSSDSEPAGTSSSSTSSALVLLTPGADSASGLVPLPDVSSTAPAAEPAAADSPPSADSAPVVSKSDSVVTAPELEKPAAKKTVTAAPKPRPVPTPSEMKKRPITKADSPPKTESKTTATKSAGKGGTHTMAKGDTLYRLSAQYGVSVDSLIKANKIKDPVKLRDGTKLVIPAK